MRGGEMQVQPRDVPQQPKPEEKAQVPSEQNELKERNAEKGVPIARPREMDSRCIRFRIPGCRVSSDGGPPQPESQRVDQRQQDSLNGDRIARPQCRDDRGIEFWQ